MTHPRLRAFLCVATATVLPMVLSGFLLTLEAGPGTKRRTPSRSGSSTTFWFLWKKTMPLASTRKEPSLGDRWNAPDAGPSLQVS